MHMAHAHAQVEAKPPCYLINPQTWRRFSWDLLISLLIVLTTVETPFTTAFLLVPSSSNYSIPEGGVVLGGATGPISAVSEWHKTTIFTIDCVMLVDVASNFFTGFVDREAGLVMDHRRIVQHYVRRLRPRRACHMHMHIPHETCTCTCTGAPAGPS